jgi:hypothetical protein
MLRPRKRILLVLAMSGALVALETPATPALGQKDACDLLKQSEIADVLDAQVGAPEELAGSCSWAINDPATPEGMTIVLTVDRGSDARSAFREGREVLRPDVVVDVDGLGKNAYFAVSTIAVLKNKKTVVYLGGIFDQAQAEELVRIAVRRA